MFDIKNNSYLFLHGDCFDLIPNLIDNSIQLLFTDPPYYILNKEDITFKDRKDMVRSTDFDQFESEAAYFVFIQQFIDLIQSKMATDSYCVFFFATQYLYILDDMLKPYGFERLTYYFFHKTNPAPRIRKNGFISAVETIAIFRRGNPPFHFFKQNEMHNFYQSPICMGNERVKDTEGEVVHETQKPLGLCKFLINVLSNEEDLVVDPFGGVATTLIACVRNNRKCISFEKNIDYYNGGVKRFNQLTGRVFMKKSQVKITQYMLKKYGN